MTSFENREQSFRLYSQFFKEGREKIEIEIFKLFSENEITGREALT